MKKIFVIAFALAITLSGCEWIKNLANVDITTDLTADIPVVVAGNKSTAAISFSKSAELNLASNADVEPYLQKIKEITLNSLVVTVNGLTGDQAINSLALDVAGVGNIFTQTSITATNNSFTPSITSGSLESAAAKLKADKKITLTVSGSASGPMSVTISLSFDTTITASPLN